MKRITKNLIFVFLLASGFNSYAGNDLTEKELFSIFDQVNGFDIETATLGVVHGNSKEVRSLAAMVLRDHSMVIQMARDLAKQNDIIYSVDGSNDSATAHQQTIESLSKLSGEAFDKAYLDHEITFHTSAINAVKNVLIPAAKGTELEGLLNAVLPGFEHHLMMTKKVAGEKSVL